MVFHAPKSERKVLESYVQILELQKKLTPFLQLYLQEIMARVLPGLASSSWSTKQQCAKASAALAEGIGGDLGPHGSTLLVALLGELPGRLWDGKEAVLHAIGGICKACSEAIISGGGKEITPEKIVAAVVAAAGRKKGSFREAAFECLEKVRGSYSCFLAPFICIRPALSTRQSDLWLTVRECASSLCCPLARVFCVCRVRLRFRFCRASRTSVVA